MTFQFNVFSVILLVSGSLTLILAFFLLNKRKGVRMLWGLIMLCAAVWALTYALELASSTLEEILFWTNFEYLGIALIPAIWILFILTFIGKGHWLTPNVVFLIFLDPIITLLLVWTNSWHHLHYARVTLEASGPFPMIGLQKGPWYYVHTAYFYVMLSWGIYLFSAKLKHADLLYRRQNIMVLIGALIPWFVNFMYLVGIRPFKNLDLTPYAFIITSLTIGIALLRFRLFDIIPIAREKILEAIPDGVLVVDVHNRVIDSNPKIREIFNFSGPSLVGIPVGKLLGEEYLSALPPETGDNAHSAIEVLVGGRLKYFAVTGTPLFERNTVYSGRIYLFREITELKEKEANLVNLNALKDRLFSIIAHDLRSPLLSLLDLLRMTNEKVVTEEEFHSFLPDFIRNVGYTSNMVENLLHWSKSQLKGEQINRTDFDFRELVASGIAQLRESAEKKGVRIVSNLGEPIMVYADPDMIRAVYRNLVSNAIKFCRPGDEISILASRKDGRLDVCINDTGSGISEEDIGKLFQLNPFTRRGTMNEQGTGLGLLICKDFLEKNDGSIRVKSTLGIGSSFCFDLPLSGVGH
ncbi:sensor histidine kinase [Hufsiella ginkgonis]|uniref:histidine kinase n=1 Tax=Hufsiella ginkgonis TaxID=2695274 RepID=A0A7K1XU90_9SPHI|nr:histidine kinase N-terminal 7TM domain-containing protein [Hufsiella ginkgonis]MXV14368.1 PAS domain-containing protein [Hufsiella ginkgonis]